jgi:SAM-dependent methyltransferase
VDRAQSSPSEERLPKAAAQRPAEGAEVLARAAGHCGELVLRRSGGQLEIIAGGSFLISGANVASSVALITAGLAELAQAAAGGQAGAAPQGLQVLIGGLGLGYSLDAALAEPRCGRVTVAEVEPVVLDWFRGFGGALAARRAVAEAAGRARVLLGDVADVLRAQAGAFDLIALDTDNGPDWLVREANAGLYDEAGLSLAHAALRPGGVAVYWSPERYEAFAARLAARFARVSAVAAHDTIDGRRHEYTMYVALRGER